MDYKVKVYKLVSYEIINISAKSKDDAKNKIISLGKKEKLKIKSENYFTEIETVK